MPKLLPDADAEEIRSKLEAGFRGPWLVVAAKRLLEDRDERIRRERETRSQVVTRGE
jgi:hypothetical protein